MDIKEIDEKFNKIKDGIYQICVALVSITDFERCEYGFEAEVKSAKDFIEKYEEEKGA